MQVWRLHFVMPQTLWSRGNHTLHLTWHVICWKPKTWPWLGWCHFYYSKGSLPTCSRVICIVYITNWLVIQHKCNDTFLENTWNKMNNNKCHTKANRSCQSRILFHNCLQVDALMGDVEREVSLTSVIPWDSNHDSII